MGSRAVVIVCRDADAARRRFALGIEALERFTRCGASTNASSASSPSKANPSIRGCEGGS